MGSEQCGHLSHRRVPWRLQVVTKANRHDFLKYGFSSARHDGQNCSPGRSLELLSTVVGSIQGLRPRLLWL